MNFSDPPPVYLGPKSTPLYEFFSLYLALLSSLTFIIDVSVTLRYYRLIICSASVQQVSLNCSNCPAQPAFTCSKLTIETPEQCVKSVQN